MLNPFTYLPRFWGNTKARYGTIAGIVYSVWSVVSGLSAPWDWLAAHGRQIALLPRSPLFGWITLACVILAIGWGIYELILEERRSLAARQQLDQAITNARQTAIELPLMVIKIDLKRKDVDAFDKALNDLTYMVERFEAHISYWCEPRTLGKTIDSPDNGAHIVRDFYYPSLAINVPKPAMITKNVCTGEIQGSHPMMRIRDYKPENNLDFIASLYANSASLRTWVVNLRCALDALKSDLLRDTKNLDMRLRLK